MREADITLLPARRGVGAPRRTFEPGEQRRFIGQIAREQLGRRRFYALAAAIREHEVAAQGDPEGIEPHDAELYRRLRAICGEL